MAQQRLDKIIASTGRFSRREVKTLVREGRVLVDGRIAASAEEKCDPESARIRVNGEEIGYRAHTYVMLHKPAGVLSATEDGRGKTVLDLLAPEYRKIGLTYARLRFTTESAEECMRVLRAYRGREEYTPKDITRGLFYRGVE